MKRVSADLIGWASSLILVVTLARQVQKQWKQRSSEGISKWLFLGQIAASAGFITYSVLIGNWIFVVTNALIAVDALVGLAIVLRHRRLYGARQLAPRSSLTSTGYESVGLTPPP